MAGARPGDAGFVHEMSTDGFVPYRRPVYSFWDEREGQAIVTARIEPAPADSVLRPALKAATKAGKRKLWLRGRLRVAVDVGRLGGDLALVARLDVRVAGKDPLATSSRIARAFMAKLESRLSSGVRVEWSMQVNRPVPARSPRNLRSATPP